MEAKFLIHCTLLVTAVAATFCLPPVASTSSSNYTSMTEEQQPTVSVQTTSGLLTGSRQPLNLPGQAQVYKFLSVPYAEAPTGSSRFKRPVALKKERAELALDATKLGKTCPQFRHLTRFISPLLNIDAEHQTSEDCLHLNFYIPASSTTDKNGSHTEISSNGRLEPSKQLPVIVWIPGEGFDFADARQFDGSYLAYKTQSIVVTVQYRVGVLGFLHAPEQGIKGNMGLYDQLMALNWVKENIQAFGGDADRVTLMGRFSGSMSISALITAQNQTLLRWNNQPLFNRVALLSGIAVNDWIIDSNQHKRATLLEELCNQNYSSTTKSAVDTFCLQKLPLEQLLPLAGYGWRLVVDNELVGQVAPAEAINRNLLAQNLESILLGETESEGTLCLYRHLLEDLNTNYARLIEENKLTSSDLMEIINYDSQTYFGYNLTKLSPIQSVLESVFLEDSPSSKSKIFSGEQQVPATSSSPSGIGGSTGAQEHSKRLREKYLKACSAFMIKSHSNRFKRSILARNQFLSNRMDSNKKPVEVFHYELRYKPTFSLAPDYIKSAAHGDDVPLIFGLIYSQPQRDINQADLLMTRNMMAYVGNFIHGNSPLLRQQKPSLLSNQADSGAAGSATSHETSSLKFSENETIISMDENEANHPNAHNSLYGEYTATAPPVQYQHRRTWTSDGSIDTIDINESDLNELASASQRVAIATTANNKNAARIYQNNPTFISSVEAATSQLTNHDLTSGYNRPAIIYARPHERSGSSNVRIIIIEGGPVAQAAANSVSEYGTIAQTLAELIEQRNQQSVEEQYDGQVTTRSQRLLELHRQQVLENNIWYQQNSRRNQVVLSSSLSAANNIPSHAPAQQPQQASTLALVNESSFLTLLIFSSGIALFALMSICLGFCLVIFRHNVSAARKSIIQQQIANSTSSCNICDDSQTGQLDTVLTSSRKDARDYCNVFAKLRNHNSSIPLAGRPQCTAANTTTTTTTTCQAGTNLDTARRQQTTQLQTTNSIIKDMALHATPGIGGDAKALKHQSE